MLEGILMGSLNFLIASLAVSLTSILCMVVIRKKKNARNRLIIALLIIVFVDSLMGMTSAISYASSAPYFVRITLCYFPKYIYYSTHFLMMPIFYYYIIRVCGIYHRLTKKHFWIMGLPVFVLEALVFSNPFTKITFYANSDLIFHRGPLVYVAYVISALYFVFCIVTLVIYWTNIDKLKKISLVYFLALAVVGIVVQMMFPAFNCELLCEAVGLMGIMIILEKDDDRADSITGLFNRNALMTDLDKNIFLKKEFHVICIRIENVELYQTIVGYDCFELVKQEIAKYLFTAAEKFDVYTDEISCFYIICPQAREKEVKKLIFNVKTRFDKSFKVKKQEIYVNPVILCVSCPDMFSSTEDIMLLGESTISDNDYGSIFMWHDLDEVKRRIDVEKAIVRGINSRRFKVKYKPIYSKSDLKLRGAEALITLEDTDMGEVSFEELISVAEKYNLEEVMQKMMIEDIFDFLDGEFEEAVSGSFDVMLIHALSKKVLNEDMTSAITKLVAKYNIDVTGIAVDISQNIFDADGKSAAYALTELKKSDIRVFLGDYRISYLDDKDDNIPGFDGVILNMKSFIDKMGMSQGRITLGKKADMIKELGKKVLITGVETEEYYDMIEDIYADYVFGSYFSVPLSKEDFVEVLKNG
ncbi:EAL domain-containing protein [Butyrivibrio sp. X503]|uniref:EAL domain-containing protein n=1 Tax=Butyrivibrio sp. X503 TaxID=2364878 RepID=UPI000EAAB9B9|nr:EAL domain-containing protein [Butyrivibrio sp. X503]RKM53896.1 EAL domain-containing protein [Butyrivibrio sp. X503]